MRELTVHLTFTWKLNFYLVQKVDIKNSEVSYYKF